MPLLMLKDLPRYDCLLAAADRYPEMKPRAHEAYLHLLRTADLVNDRQRAFLGRTRLTQGRFSVLMLLRHAFDETDPATPAALAEMAGVTRATMTGLLNTLERDGLIAREADPHDRRLIRVQLTAEGNDFLETLVSPWFANVGDMISPLSEAECAQLVFLLQKLQRHLTTPAVVATEVSS